MILIKKIKDLFENLDIFDRALSDYKLFWIKRGIFSRFDKAFSISSLCFCAFLNTIAISETLSVSSPEFTEGPAHVNTENLVYQLKSADDKIGENTEKLKRSLYDWFNFSLVEFYNKENKDWKNQFNKILRQMSQFGASSSINDESSSLHSDFGPGMMSDQESKQQKLPLLSFKYHPGFFCFFQQYTNQQGWTFHECYEKVFQSHHEMMKIRRSTQQIANDNNLDKTQKIKELMHRAQKNKVFALYLKRPDGELQCNIVSHEDKRIQEISKLTQQLEKLQKIKAKVIQDKKKEFHQKEVQRSKEQEKEIEGILNEKQRRAQLIRKVQMEALQKRLQRQKQRQANPGLLASTFSNCQIM